MAMITARELKAAYAESDALAASGNRAGAERVYLDAVAAVERSPFARLRTQSGALEALDLAAYLSTGGSIANAIRAALELEGLPRLIGLRAALALVNDDEDALALDLARRALAALARPWLVEP